MGRRFMSGKMPAGTAPNTEVVAATAGQTFLRGALVIMDSNGTLVECGANPAAVFGVAGADAFQGYGYAAANNPAPITGQGEKNTGVPVIVADRKSIYSGRAINGATDPLTPTVAMRKVKYGVSKVGSDWVINQADTTNLVVQIIDVDIPNKVFFFKVLESVLQTV